MAGDAADEAPGGEARALIRAARALVAELSEEGVCTFERLETDPVRTAEAAPDRKSVV